ncbi:MAG: GAF domain-containing protein [Lachnospiraceae bacterium]|nr:GAF domain-containing protein [Lachnospiraceae bacterium]
MYKTMIEQLKSLTEGEDDIISNLSNASALINETLPDLNWAGFYLMKEGRLQLGPFQGKTACLRIPLGKGVCGTAAAEDKTQLVKDVHEFPGHIACDSASNSEIVVPIHKDGKVFGVLDIDSPSLNRFTEEDKAGLEEFVKILETVI